MVARRERFLQPHHTKELVSVAVCGYGTPAEWVDCDVQSTKYVVIWCKITACLNLVYRWNREGREKQRGTVRDFTLKLKDAGLTSQWDPLGVLFFVKEFELQFDKGNVVLVQSSTGLHVRILRWQ